MKSEYQKKILFITGTRADFGKLKPLIKILQKDFEFKVHVFITGMHMLAKYGYTCEEVEASGFENLYKYINQNAFDGMEQVLAKTVLGLSDYSREIRPDMIVVHGDRVEALAGAIVGSLTNVITAHIEGGEVSGTVDELIRHAVSKLSHLHFVANFDAKRRLTQLGEKEDNVYIIGSPDIDVMNSKQLPSLDEVCRHYDISYEKYAIAIYHPVTTEIESLEKNISNFIFELKRSKKNYIVIYPNNDMGTDIILKSYEKLKEDVNFRLIPSMRFEYFLTLLRQSDFIVGNSSSGIREAPHYGVPTINVGTRQFGRFNAKSILNVTEENGEISNAIKLLENLVFEKESNFGDGDSAKKFYKTLKQESLWHLSRQKIFNDI